MSEIFISYARSTEGQARTVAEALRALGYSVWRDDELPAHRVYAEVIEERLAAAKAVVVIWSAEAVKSQWVRSEANQARRAQKLVQLTVDGTRPPMPFETILCADLKGWSGATNAAGWLKVVASIAELVGVAPASVPSAASSRATATRPLPAKLAIALMPLVNLSSDPDTDSIAVGMTEEIATALSRFRAVMVIGGGSTQSLSGKPRTPQEVARQLDVRYVLEGSVRGEVARVRVAVSLISGVDGAQLWGERFEGTLKDVFALQDRVALAVAAAVPPAMFAAETRRTSGLPTDDLGAYDLYLRANALMKTHERSAQLEAIEILQRVVALDPGFALAFALEATIHAEVALTSSSDERKRHRDQAMRMSQHARQLAEDDPNVLCLSASTLATLGDIDLATGLADRAVRLNPGSHHTWFASGWIRVKAGDSDQGAERIETSLRLDPLSSDRGQKLAWLGIARFNQGRYPEALALLKESAHLLPSNPITPPVLASCQAHLGQLSAARETLENPAIATPEIVSRLFSDSEHRRRFLDGIAIARGATSS